MVRRNTAHRLWDQYGVTSPPGDINHHSDGWWLLVTSRDETSPATPGTLLSCLKTFPTLAEFDITLCYHLAGTFRGKIFTQHWLQQLAIIFCRQAKIRLMDKHTYMFGNPVTEREALVSVSVHDWFCTSLGNQPSHRTVWQDLRGLVDHLTSLRNSPSTSTGRLLTKQPKVNTNYLP